MKVLLSIKVTIDQSNLVRNVVTKWIEDLLNINHLMHDNWVVFQDMKPPKSLLRKSTDMRRPIQRVTFTKAIARHTKIRDQNPSLGYICPGEPHQRSPNAPKFEDRSQEETEWQEQGAPEAAWKLAKSVLKFSPGKANDWRTRERDVLDLFSNLKLGKIQGLLSVNLWGNPTWANFG